MSDIVLCMMAHPDDEVLGCGGTLAKYSGSGASVHARFLSTGVGAREQDRQQSIDATKRRVAEMQAAARILGMASTDCGAKPDQRFDTVPQLGINELVEKWVAEIKPSIIFTHTPHDLNQDHRIVYEAVMVATRPWVYTAPCVVYGVEAGGRPKDLIPDVWVRLTDREMKAKIRALKAYASEVRKKPHPRSVEAVAVRALTRGVEAAWGAAEAFEVLREVR